MTIETSTIEVLEDSDCDFYGTQYWRSCSTHSDCMEQVCGDCGDIEQCDKDPKEAY